MSEGLLAHASDLLSQPGSYGSVIFRYASPSSGNLFATALISIHGEPISFPILARAKRDDRNVSPRSTLSSLEGIWWQPRSALNDVLVISNSAENRVMGTLVLTDASGKQWSQALTLGPRQAQRFSTADLIRKAGLNGTYGGISFIPQSSTDTVGAVHFLYDEVSKFSTALDLVNRYREVTLLERAGRDAKHWTMYAPMLALQHPDPALGLPSGIELQPTLLVRNTTSKRVVANLSLAYRGDSVSGQLKLPILQLGPFATQEIQFSNLQLLRIPDNAQWGMVTLTTDALPDDLVAFAISMDASGRYSLATRFAGGIGGHFTGGEWVLDANHNEIAAVTNIGSNPTDAQLTLRYDNGKKSYELRQTIAPGGQMWINLAQLVRGRVADRNGNTLPINLSSMTYELHDLTAGSYGLMANSLALENSLGFHGVRDILRCCGSDQPIWDPGLFDLLPGADAGGQIWGVDQCTGEPVNLTPDFPTWWSDNTNVASVTSQKVHAVAVGSANAWSSGWVSEGNASFCTLVHEQPSAPVIVVQAQITSADLESNQVDVKLLGPTGTSGTLQVIAFGVNNQASIMYNGGAAVGPGSYTVGLNRPYMAADTYSKVEAIWNYNLIPATATLNLSPGWLVLGTIRHSQYNSPYESAWTGSPQTAWTFNSSCTFTQTTLKSDFVSQTYINGTGVSQSHGILKYSKSCTNYPQGANSQNSFLTVSSITGACNTPMSGGVSVATYPSPNVGNPYGCGDDILLVTSSNANQAVKNAADYCPACSGGFNGTNGHIDDYSSSQACSGNAVGDLGNFWTADTH